MLVALIISGIGMYIFYKVMGNHSAFGDLALLFCAILVISTVVKGWRGGPDSSPALERGFGIGTAIILGLILAAKLLG